MKIDLDEIIECIEDSSRDISFFLNTATGDIIMRDEKMPSWELNDVENELDDNWETIVEIPGQQDVDAFGMMHDFAREQPRGQARDALFLSLKGQGAFKRFKDVCANFNLLNQWIEYRDNRYMQEAKTWALENGLSFDDKVVVMYRHATRDDVNLLVDLKKKQLGIQDNALDFELEKYFSSQIRFNNLYTLFSLCQDEVVACGSVQWIAVEPSLENPSGKTGRLCNFWCREDLRDQNIEEELVFRIVEEARRKRIYSIYADEDMKKICKEVGFEAINVLKKKI